MGAITARNRHLEVLQWARAHGCPWDKATCAAAALNKHFEVHECARTYGCLDYSDKYSVKSFSFAGIPR